MGVGLASSQDEEADGVGQFAYTCGRHWRSDHPQPRQSKCYERLKQQHCSHCNGKYLIRQICISIFLKTGRSLLAFPIRDAKALMTTYLSIVNFQLSSSITHGKKKNVTEATKKCQTITAVWPMVSIPVCGLVIFAQRYPKEDKVGYVLFRG